MASTPSKTDFFTLPRELRDMIYEIAFNTEVYRKGPFHPQPATELNGSLLLASRQTYHETKLLYYKHSTFFFKYASECLSWYVQRPTEVCEQVQDLVYQNGDVHVLAIVALRPLNINPGALKRRTEYLGDIPIIFV